MSQYLALKNFSDRTSSLQYESQISRMTKAKRNPVAEVTARALYYHKHLAHISKYCGRIPNYDLITMTERVRYHINLVFTESCPSLCATISPIRGLSALYGRYPGYVDYETTFQLSIHAAEFKIFRKKAASGR